MIGGCQAAGRNQAVQVGMKLQLLIPGMEYGENADASTEAVSIGGDLHQGLGDSTK